MDYRSRNCRFSGTSTGLIVSKFEIGIRITGHSVRKPKKTVLQDLPNHFSEFYRKIVTKPRKIFKTEVFRQAVMSLVIYSKFDFYMRSDLSFNSYCLDGQLVLVDIHNAHTQAYTNCCLGGGRSFKRHRHTIGSGTELSRPKYRDFPGFPSILVKIIW